LYCEILTVTLWAEYVPVVCSHRQLGSELWVPQTAMFEVARCLEVPIKKWHLLLKLSCHCFMYQVLPLSCTSVQSIMCLTNNLKCMHFSIGVDTICFTWHKFKDCGHNCDKLFWVDKTVLPDTVFMTLCTYIVGVKLVCHDVRTDKHEYLFVFTYIVCQSTWLLQLYLHLHSSFWKVFLFTDHIQYFKFHMLCLFANTFQQNKSYIMYLLHSFVHILFMCSMYITWCTLLWR
jgi:hypothetical protein